MAIERAHCRGDCTCASRQAQPWRSSLSADTGRGLQHTATRVLPRPCRERRLQVRNPTLSPYAWCVRAGLQLTGRHVQRAFPYQPDFTLPLSRPQTSKKEQNVTTTTRAKRARSRVAVRARSFLDAGAEVLAGSASSSITPFRGGP